MKREEGHAELIWSDRRFPMTVEVKIKNGTARFEMVDGRAVLPVPGEMESEIDPGQWLLMERE